jgi:hypothetical protein
MATPAATASAAPAKVAMMPSPVLLVTRAVVGGDGLGQETIVRLPDALGGFLTERGALDRGVDEVREENRRRPGPRAGGVPRHQARCLTPWSPS